MAARQLGASTHPHPASCPAALLPRPWQAGWSVCPAPSVPTSRELQVRSHTHRPSGGPRGGRPPATQTGTLYPRSSTHPSLAGPADTPPTAGASQAAIRPWPGRPTPRPPVSPSHPQSSIRDRNWVRSRQSTARGAGRAPPCEQDLVSPGRVRPSPGTQHTWGCAVAVPLPIAGLGTAPAGRGRVSSCPHLLWDPRLSSNTSPLIQTKGPEVTPAETREDKQGSLCPLGTKDSRAAAVDRTGWFLPRGPHSWWAEKGVPRRTHSTYFPAEKQPGLLWAGVRGLETSRAKQVERVWVEGLPESAACAKALGPEGMALSGRESRRGGARPCQPHGDLEVTCEPRGGRRGPDFSGRRLEAGVGGVSPEQPRAAVRLGQSACALSQGQQLGVTARSSQDP